MRACMRAWLRVLAIKVHIGSNSENYAIAKLYHVCTYLYAHVQISYYSIMYSVFSTIYSILIPSLMGIIPAKARAAYLHMYTQ